MLKINYLRGATCLRAVGLKRHGSVGAGCASGVFQQERKKAYESTEVVKRDFCVYFGCFSSGMWET